MNKQIIFICIIGFILFYYFNNTFENFTWSWGYFPNKIESKNNSLPKGSWKTSCKVQDFRDPFLWASCETDRGKYIDTSIDAGKCYEKQIKNVNGILECE